MPDGSTPRVAAFIRIPGLHDHRWRTLALSVLAATVLLGLMVGRARSASDPCAAPILNPVACENSKPGTAPSDWQVTGAGDASIQGYGTAMSVTPGQTIAFKIKTPSTSYHLDILRLGYYQGLGARKVAANIRPSASLPQTQPACMATAATGLIDCGNWAVSASWTVPANAVSGVYIAHLMRDDAAGESQIPFVVRDDSSHSDVVVATSDSTWQAYNAYGGNSLYQCTVSCPPGSPLAYKGAYAVSYNRPFDGTVTSDAGRSYLYYAEYSMIRFLERNGYDVSYMAQNDVDSRGSLLTNHKLYVSSGHDEYWSAGMRNNVEAARDAGVSLAFFSGNEVFWKTRFAPSSDGANTPNRTLITYKDTHFASPVDPLGPNTTTPTWRDPRFSPPGDAGRPENSLTGQLFIVNSGTSDIVVPAQYRNLRLWRNTAVASLGAGQSRTLGAGLGTLGYEWDVDADNGFRPRGLFDLSSTTVTAAETFSDYGSTTTHTTATHHLTSYRAPSGAQVFGAGTVQWAWGLDTTNAWQSGGPPNGGSPDPVMQQATVNLFADMGAQPATLASGLAPAGASTDTIAPTSTIAAPTDGASVRDGTQVTISGTASDVGGTVGGVEVSTDGGSSWHPATGGATWSYTWTAHGYPTAQILSRAVDDSGNVQLNTAGVKLSITCPCNLWGAGLTPDQVDAGDATGVEVGVAFKSDLVGTVDGIRFYKAAANTGTHVGNLWRTDGTLLARGTFTGESASGWQTLTFATPVAITAGTTYIASYYAPVGHYSASENFFYAPSPLGGTTLDAPPLHARTANGTGGNGVYTYGSSTRFPALGGDGANYGVDVAFTPSAPPGQVTAVSATGAPGGATLSWTAPGTGGPVTDYTITPFAGTTALPATRISGSPPAVTAAVAGLDAGTSYTFTVRASNPNGSGPASASSNAVTPTAPVAPDAPTAVVATSGNTKANVRWTAPADGGRTIASYTVTPYANGLPQATTTVSGSPAPTSAAITGLSNGVAYAFAVTATNSVGTGPASARSNAVTPGPAPLFVQKVSGRNPSTQTLQFTPTADVTTGNRIVVMAGVWSSSRATISGVSDSAGNTYVKATSFKAADDTEMSVWTAPIIAGGGSRPTISIAATGVADIGGAALEYSGLSTAAGSAAIDAVATATGTTPGTVSVSSGATAPVAADNELAMGFYVDSGFGQQLVADPSYNARVNVSPTSDMEFVVEDTVANIGDAPNARVTTGPATPWLMATVVFKYGAAAPATAPGSPTNVSATAGDQRATVAWTAPPDGGSPITGYAVTPYIGSVPQALPTNVSASARSAPVTGLLNGVAYSFRVTATNSIGTSPPSAASNAVTPSAPTAPGAPQSVTAVAGDQRATVDWMAPTADGGSALTSYRVTPYDGSTALPATTVTGSPPASRATVTGLTNGTAYTFSVTAVNSVGSGPESARTSPVTPGTPSAPTFVQQVSGRTPTFAGSLTLTPTSALTSGDRLVVMASIWSLSADTITGVTDAAGNTYTKVTSIKATDSTELSVWSAPITVGGGSRPAVRIAASGAADIGAAALEYAGLSAAADATAVDRLATATGTTAAAGTVSSGATAATTADNELAVGFYSDSGFGRTLSAGASFTQRVNVSPTSDMEFLAEDRVVPVGATPAATAGTGAATPWLMAGVVFKTGAVQAPTAPAAPTGVTASAGDGKATVSWTVPSSNGSPISSYTVTPYAGTTAQAPVTVSGSPPVTSTTVNGLTNGTAYTFKVAATNAIGTGPASDPSAAVTPSGPAAPNAPTGVTATAGDGRATVSWTAPSSNGGSAITSYVVTPYVGSTAQTPATVTGSPPGTSATVTGLTNGTTYTFTVQAVNAIGSSPESGRSAAVTPTAPTAPGAPTAVTATAGNAKATVSWTAPTSNGGAAIGSYVVTPYVGSAPQTATTVTGSPPATTATVTGLTNGTSYTFSVAAANSVGTGPESTRSAAVTPSAILPPAFVQQVSKRSAARTDVLTPTVNVTTGNRLVVLAGVWSSSNATISGVTDAAGNTYTKVTSVKASDATELSVWTAPITAGNATKPAITVTATGTADIGAAAVEYSGLSTASGAAAVDRFVTATGKTTAAGAVSSGATAATTADNELAIGFYADSGFGATLTADAAYTQRVNVSPTSDMEFVVEDRLVGLGSTSGATVRTGAAIPWLMATAVFKGSG